MSSTLDFPGYVTAGANLGYVPPVVWEAMRAWLRWPFPQKAVDALGEDPALIEISAIGNDLISYKPDVLPTDNFKGPRETWVMKEGDCEEQALFKMAAVHHYRRSRLEVGLMLVTYVGGPDHAYAVTRDNMGKIMVLNNSNQAPCFRFEELQKSDDVAPKLLLWADEPADGSAQVIVWGRPRTRAPEPPRARRVKTVRARSFQEADDARDAGGVMIDHSGPYGYGVFAVPM